MATFKDLLTSVETAVGGDLHGADVSSALDSRAGNQLQWRYSIVDLMKVLGLNSDPESRADLARDVGYEGHPVDSAPMNIWLHKRILKMLGAKGANVPGDLKE